VINYASDKFVSVINRYCLW